VDGRATRRRARRRVQDEGPRFLRTGPSLDADRPEGRAAGHSVQPGGRTRHTAMIMAGPDRRRGSLRQVTTATPAGLDFRATGVADEGCADTMSTESTCSIALGLSGLKPAIWIATRKRQEFWAFFVGICWKCQRGLVFSGAASNTSTGGTRANLEASSVDPYSQVSTSASSIGMTLRLSC